MSTNHHIVIMAAGASSRMKKSLNQVQLSEKTLRTAEKEHKSLIPVTKEGHSLLELLLYNIEKAGYSDVYIVTSENNLTFKKIVGEKDKDNYYEGVRVHFAVQKIAPEREKPDGTADAILQVMDSYPELKSNKFTVCNGDNLYSIKVLELLKEPRNVPNALIAYARSGLNFPPETISKFAILSQDSQGHLKRILEKPNAETILKYTDSFGEVRVSMNVFSFDGDEIYPFIRDCPFNEVRNEKELPSAVANYVSENPKGTICIPVSEHLPDLTTAHDIKTLLSS